MRFFPSPPFRLPALAFFPLSALLRQRLRLTIAEEEGGAYGDDGVVFLDDAIAFVPTGVDSSDWQTMCEMWTTGDERSNMHGRTPHRLEVFKMGRCKDLPDDSESWVDKESRRRYEVMTQMIAPSSDVDAESHTTATPKDAFISVMGKDRPGRVRCAGSGETLSTWYGATGTSACSERERIMQ
ncbi:hypothetical protein Taro_056853 [Colocasia esculenta]|uniref:Uncharacterized protein n=1 Tax=Colocasia esculenta TaxID=4460 RepID=A0A843XXD2_COLES|nr:hypothetical protein [Colocasia esculenta]